MLTEFSRTELLLGSEAMDKLINAKVAVFGVGGVGAACCEALARAGIANLTLIDGDTISVTNRNRQIIALNSTTGMPKAQAMADRIKDINPNCNVTALQLFLTEQSDFDFTKFDYIVDAIDTVSAKLFMIEKCYKQGVNIISSMGTGNKLDPTQFEVSDIYKTSVCPLARVMRKELKNRGVKKLKVVYSKEEPQKIPKERYQNCLEDKKGTAGRPVPASISFVPPVAGMILAGEVIKDLIKL